MRGYGVSWELSPLTRFALDDAPHRETQNDLSPLGRGEGAPDTHVQWIISESYRNPNRSTIAMIQNAPAIKSATPTAAEPMSLTRPICLS